MSKKLVAYFSASGITEHVAKVVASAAGADIYKIRPEVPYSSADLNWLDKNARSTFEMHNKAYRPAIKKEKLNLENYDQIFVGFPIWWYVAPTIINTFLESFDFSNKTVILFATSGGSGFGNTLTELRSSVSETTTLLEGSVFTGTVNSSDVDKWIKSMTA